MQKKVLVLGASLNPERYANKAIRLLLKNNEKVVAFGLSEGQVEDVKITNLLIEYTDIHTVSIYLSPKNQIDYYNYIISLKPKRVIFNPGTENSDFALRLEKEGVEVVENCTLVMLNFGIF